MRSILTRKRLFYGLFFVSFCSVFFIANKTLANTDTSQKNLVLIINDQTKHTDSQQMRDWFSIQTKLNIDTHYRSEIENAKLCPLEFNFCDFILSQKTRSSLKNYSVSILNKEAVQKYIETLDTEISKAPVDAKFTVDENKVSVFSISQDGWQIDTDASVSLIADALTNANQKETLTIELPVIQLKPAVSSSDAEHLGIVELIGEGSTNFAGSPKNRIYNFKRALEQFNGIMVAPNEEFSFVKLLGDVDGEHGYLPELVIKHDKTEPEFGGGICQVSSTVFRAAIYSGLKITARRNHAYPVSYYKPYGMDATIYVPKPDLRFINNTPGHILMQSSIEGTKLTFRFYGTSDGRKTEVDGPHILEHNPDGSMKTIFTQKVTGAQGETLIDDDFRSSYASPSKYPHPGQEPIFTEKPDDWSQSQWSVYKKAHNL
jgi:vancomycin resistance protein YoaR